MNGTAALGHEEPLGRPAVSAGESRAQRAARLLAEPPLPRQVKLDTPSESQPGQDKRAQMPGAIRRLARAAAVYAARGDEPELLVFRDLITYMEKCLDYVAVAQHRDDRTWQAIGEALGRTRQRAHQRWGHLDLDDLAAQIGLDRVPVRCSAPTRRGTPCRNWAAPGSTACHVHRARIERRAET